MFGCGLEFRLSLGKSAETIGAFLEARLKFLAARRPALLLLDDLDFLNCAVEDEERVKFVAKVYSSEFSPSADPLPEFVRLLRAFKVPVVATAHSRHSLPTDVLNQGGRRLFSLTLEVPALGQVGYSNRGAEFGWVLGGV